MTYQRNVDYDDHVAKVLEHKEDRHRRDLKKFLHKNVGEPTPTAPLEKEIRAKCNELADFLVEKNRAYGNSALEPVGIFAKRLDNLSQIDVRIDDKLSRMMKGSEYVGDDTVKDLTGYLILRSIATES